MPVKPRGSDNSPHPVSIIAAGGEKERSSLMDESAAGGGAGLGLTSAITLDYRDMSHA